MDSIMTSRISLVTPLLSILFGSILDPVTPAYSGIHAQFGEDEFIEDKPCSHDHDNPDKTLHHVRLSKDILIYNI